MALSIPLLVPAASPCVPSSSWTTAACDRHGGLGQWHNRRVGKWNGNLLGLNSDGSLDTAFGSGGTVNTGMSITGGLLTEPNGELLVGGTSGLGRYNADGNLDTTFGTGGIVAIHLS